MDENKEKNYKVEWSFSFEKLGEQIGDFFKSLGDSRRGGDQARAVQRAAWRGNLGARARRFLGRRSDHQAAQRPRRT